MSEEMNSLVSVESSVGMINQHMVDGLKKQRELLVSFVSSQLKRDADYGIIPGTKKNSLYKPGAEKLRALFNLSISVELKKQDIDRQNNFAMFTYKSAVKTKDGVLVAECEASCNSQEKKYKERTVWVEPKGGGRKQPQVEETPIFDIMNTLMKMAQKRAYVGAVILACGASDFFTQDIDDPEDARQVGITPEVRNVNKAPKVTNVSNQPKQNNQSKQGGNSALLVEAVVEFKDKELAKSAGFQWSKTSKKWLKEMSADEFNRGFDFPVQEVAGA